MKAESVQLGGQICREDTPGGPHRVTVVQGRQEFWLQQVTVPKFLQTILESEGLRPGRDA